jgi:hypothetical protein
VKKSHLLGIVSALPFLVTIISANADLIASDGSSVTRAGQSHDLTFALSPLSISDTTLTSDVSGDFGQIQSDGNFNHFKDGVLPASPVTDSQITSQTNSHIDIWLLLIVAAVAGTLSEVFHRKYFNR